MSDIDKHILFEHPLNEKMRTWLRLEFLLQQLHELRHLDSAAHALTFFHTAADLLDVLERGEVRTELLKELERQQQKLLSWNDVPGVDQTRVNTLREQLKTRSNALMSAPRLGQLIREDRLITSVRQRLSIPGGCCSFDLPTLHAWLHLATPLREKDVSLWLDSLSPLHLSLAVVLDLIRQTNPFRERHSLNGFFQDNAEGADILRLRISLDYRVYPQISGHKTRYAIRFLPLDSDQSQIPPNLLFEVTCC